jgi:HEAT repeat protein
MGRQTSLIDQLARIDDSDGRTANALLSDFFRRRPIIELREALSSQNQRVVKHAIWIASELGSKAVDLLNVIDPLLRHPLPYVRYLALEVVLVCAGQEHSATLASAITLLRDENTSVRKNAINFCSRASFEQLEAGIEKLSEESWIRTADWLHSLRWILSSDSSDPDKVRAAASSSESSMHLVGVIAAARLGNEGIKILSNVRSSGDDAIRRFIKDWLELHLDSDTNERG